MQNYKDLISDILANGTVKGDRTGTGTISVFDRNLKWDLREGLPVVTLKKTGTAAITHELLWFLGNHLQNPYYKQFGRTNIKYLVDHNCNIWNDWPHKAYCKVYGNIDIKEFKLLIKNCDDFALKHGNLGPVYGSQWRDWKAVNGRKIDQIADVIAELKSNPDSRRLLVSAWNVGELEEMNISGLSPCHYGFQFYTEEVDGERFISMKWHQRSVDCFLGLPFNIASYSILLHMVAQVTGYTAKTLSFSGGDCHIYSNHIDQSNEMVSREPLGLAKLELTPDIDSIDDFTFSDINVVEYESHSAIRAPIAV